MNITYQAKVGILSIIGIGILLWTYTFLRKKNVFNDAMLIYAQYENVEGLSKSDPIYMSGLQVGAVGNVKFSKDFSKLIVRLDIESSLQLPKNTVAEITSMGVMGDKGMRLIFDDFCTENCLKSGDIIKGTVTNAAEEVVDLLEPYIPKIEAAFERFDTIVSELLDEETGVIAEYEQTTDDFGAMLSNFDRFANRMDQLKKSNAVNASTATSPTSTVPSNNEPLDLDKMMVSMNQLSEKISKINLNNSVAETEKSIAEVEGLLKKAKQSLDGVGKQIAAMEAGKGTIGKLITKREVYDSFNVMMINMDSLLVKYREIPKSKKKKKSKK